METKNSSPRHTTDDWSEGPGATFAPHSHPYHKTLTCVKGSIEFTIHPVSGNKNTSGGGKERVVTLKTGDVLKLPPGTIHSAVVGPDGVSCHEDHVYS